MFCDFFFCVPCTSFDPVLSVGSDSWRATIFIIIDIHFLELPFSWITQKYQFFHTRKNCSLPLCYWPFRKRFARICQVMDAFFFFDLRASACWSQEADCMRKGYCAARKLTTFAAVECSWRQVGFEFFEGFFKSKFIYINIDKNMYIHFILCTWCICNIHTYFIYLYTQTYTYLVAVMHFVYVHIRAYMCICIQNDV